MAVLAFVAVGEGTGPRTAFRSVANPARVAVAAGIAVASASFIVALNHTSIAHVLVIQAITPILAGLFAFWTLREPLSARLGELQLTRLLRRCLERESS